jgi:uncharacterized protein (DUF433 family)
MPSIVKDDGICGGDARVAGTRLSVWGLVQWKNLGYSDARLLLMYPQLTPGDLASAWAYADLHPDEIEQAIRENAE